MTVHLDSMYSEAHHEYTITILIHCVHACTLYAERKAGMAQIRANGLQQILRINRRMDR